MDIIVTPVGGKRIDAQLGRFTIHTDQSPANGGEGIAIEPFALFLVSLATCAGAYVVEFCKARDIPTEGIRLVQHSDSDPVTGHLERVRLEVQVPENFPPRYREAVARAAAACKVGKALRHPPELQVTTHVAGRETAAPAA
jgi:putative redox protein